MQPPVVYKPDKSRSMAQEVTEYDAQFAGVQPRRPESPQKPVTHGVVTAKKAPAAHAQPHFEGLSEYDDKFASAAPAAAVTHHKSKHENTLRHTNMEQRNLTVLSADAPVTDTLMSQDSLNRTFSAAPTVVVPRPHQAASPVKGKKKSKHVAYVKPTVYSTEQSDNFKWPKGKAAASAMPAQNNVHSSKVPMGSNYANSGFSERDDGAAGEKENSRLAGNSFTGLSESHTQFAWPPEKSISRPGTTSGILKAPVEDLPVDRSYKAPAQQRSAPKASRPVSTHSDSHSVQSRSTTASSSTDPRAQRHVHHAAALDSRNDAFSEDEGSTQRALPTAGTTATLTETSSNLSSTTGTRSRSLRKSSAGELRSQDEFYPSTQDSVAPSDCGASSSTITSYRQNNLSVDNESSR